MRIIAGQWRSRRLSRPDESVTRPMPDRVKESIFNMLGVYYETPGLLPALHVADVFAGGGSMGLEALSRGAERCVFFERDRETLRILRRNLVGLGVVEPQGVVHGGDAWQSAVVSATDLMFLDPPFADSKDASEVGTVRRFLAELGRRESCPRLIVFHHEHSARYPSDVSAWRTVDEREFGSNRVTFWQR